MDFNWKDLKEGQDIIIYGASTYGELALCGLKKLGIAPLCFADRSRKSGESYLGVPVISPDMLKEHREACILIASADFYYEIYNFLEHIDCENICNISSLLRLDLPIEELSNRAKEMYDARYNYFNIVNGTELTIVHLGFCVSERCSLKCRDCSFLMQYYEKPQNINLEYYRPALERFLEAIDYISEFRVYGGEPFMNKDMYKLLEWYKDCSKIGTLSIYTNGTIIPDEKTLHCMTYDKVKVHISDYGHNMDKVEKLIRVLEERRITYFVRKYDLWQQAGDLEDKHHTEDECRNVYSRCFATNCYYFLKGKFYVCPRAAHAVNLEAMEDYEKDRVDFNDTTTFQEEFKRQLIELMHHRDYIEACRYCNGLDNHSTTRGVVKPAIQTNSILTYKKLNIPYKSNNIQL